MLKLRFDWYITGVIFGLTREQTFTVISLNNPVYGQHLIMEIKG